MSGACVPPGASLTRKRKEGHRRQAMEAEPNPTRRGRERQREGKTADGRQGGSDLDPDPRRSAAPGNLREWCQNSA